MKYLSQPRSLFVLIWLYPSSLEVPFFAFHGDTGYLVIHALLKKIILSMSYFLAVFLFFTLYVGDLLAQKLSTIPKFFGSIHESAFASRLSMPDISKFDAAAVERIALYKNAITSISNNWLLGSSYLITPEAMDTTPTIFFWK